LVKKTVIIAILIATLIIASAYIIYSQYGDSPLFSSFSSSSNSSTQTQSSSDDTSNESSNKSTSSSSSEQSSNSTTITIIDGAGHKVNLPDTPIQRIVVLDGNLAEMLCYMGLQNSIVGRTDAGCPPQLLNVKSVGEAGYALNVEVILELNPDIVIADQVLPSDYYGTGAYTKLKDAGIPIYISEPPASAQNPLQMTPTELYNAPTGIDVVCSVMQGLSTVVGNKDRVDAYVTWAQGYNKIVKDRIATLPREQQTIAFFEWNFDPYFTTVDMYLYQAGGINIAENSSIAYLYLSPEVVVEQNPSVIIELISSPTHDINDFIAARNDALTRFQGIDAVTNGCVYVSDFAALNGLRSIIGYLYWAKWVQPDLFSDIDPAAVAVTLNQQFLGTPTTDVYCYPR